MDTTMEVGQNFEATEAIGLIDRDMNNKLEETVRAFLAEQEESFAYFMELEDVIDEIRQGRLVGGMYLRNDVPMGIVLYTFRHERQGLFARLEFVSCSDFHAMAGVWDFLEAHLRALKVNRVEATAHPTIARYAVKKKGFGCLGVHISKRLDVSGRN